MTSRVYGMILGMGAVGVLVGALLFGLRPQAQEAEENEVDHVSANELTLYIDVYTSMQADHDLTLDTVLAQKGTSLEQFRNIERRVQKQERLIRKVRDALQAQAKARTDAIAPPAARAEAPAAKPAP
jgi:GTP cyclohydrolase I